MTPFTEKSLTRRRLATVSLLAGIIVALFALVLDKYNSGIWVGPPERLTWEPAAALLSCVGLLLVLVSACKSEVLSLRIALLEVSFFLVVNLVLLSRDGAGRLSDAGYVHSFSGLASLSLGVAARAFLLMGLMVRRASGVTDPRTRTARLG